MVLQTINPRKISIGCNGCLMSRISGSLVAFCIFQFQSEMQGRCCSIFKRGRYACTKTWIQQLYQCAGGSAGHRQICRSIRDFYRRNCRKEGNGRVFGVGKGIVTCISPGFNEPLEKLERLNVCGNCLAP